MLMPADMLIGLQNFPTSLISVEEIKLKKAPSHTLHKKTITMLSALAFIQNPCEVSGLSYQLLQISTVKRLCEPKSLISF